MAETSNTETKKTKTLPVKKKKNTKYFLVGAFLLLLSGLFTYDYLLNLDQAHVTTASTSFPGVTRYETPDPVTIVFKNDADRNKKDYHDKLRSPIAPLDKLDKVISEGISLTPALAGEWKWTNESTLRFLPKQDWPADQDFFIHIDQKLFDAKALPYHGEDVEFSTPYFQSEITNMSLEQDVAGGRDHNIFATFTFTHPVDQSSLAKNITLRDGDKEVPFELSYEDDLKTAYLRSHIVNIDTKERYINLTLLKGVQTTLGKATLFEAKEQKILIPDIYSFLKIDNLDYSIINDKEGNPEQVFHLSLTDGVTLKELNQHLKFSIRLQKGEKEKPEYTQITPLENEHETSKDYFFKTQIDAKGEVEVTLSQGLKSVNGFELRREIKDRRSIPAYPTELKIMGEGSLLALSGDKKLSFATRGIPALRVSVQKLQNDQINHLITQTYGDISSPEFRSYNFTADDMSERELVKTIALASTHPKDRNYASLNLTRYLKNQGSGIFFVKVQDWDINANRSNHYLEDRRLVIITDMGLIIKKAANGSRDVFIESIANGQAISGAQINVLGRNGQSIAQTSSSVDGKAHFHNLSSYKGAQYPTVIVAKKGNDLSFIPYDGYDRHINFSKFDVGGLRNYKGNAQKQLSAYAFSDRGIYRPGENVHLAAIVRQGNFELAQGTVVRAKIFNPRGKITYKNDLTLNKDGLFEIDLPTDLSSPTGEYSLSIYLPHHHKNGYTREDYLGGVNFSVEEFQPDTMKIKTVFNPRLQKGWLPLKDLKAEIKLSNLFGLPAQDRIVKARATLIPTSFHFAQYNDYRFYAPLLDEKVRRQEQISFNDIRTDKEGFASFDVNLPYDRGGFQIDFQAEGFEPNRGRSVKAKARTLLSDAEYMMGVKADGGLDYLKKGQARNLNFIAVDPMLSQISLDELRMELVYNKRLSVLTKQRDGRYSYETVIKKETWMNKGISLAKTGLDYKLDTSEGGDFTVNIKNKGGELLSSVDYHVAASGNLTGALEKNAELSVKLDKKTYLPGEDIEMNIVAPYTGTGLITIESDRVLAHKWFKTNTTSSIEHITLPHGLEGNAYINVTFVRSIDSQEIFTSPLSFSVQPFSIDSSKRNIDIKLTTPALIKPGENLPIGFKTDRKAKIIVYAVNEGILQVSKYRLPQPTQHFLKKRALDVETFQILDLILPEFSKFIQHSGIGGGEMDAMAAKALGANLNPFQRTLDKPAVYWSGIIDADGTDQEVSFSVPDTFNGNLKVMAVAVSEEAMGASATESKVRGPFILSPNVLTMAAPGDAFEVSVGVSNALEGSGKNVPVDISIELSKNLSLISEARISKSISEGDEDKATFKIKALDGLGEGRITFKASSGTHFQTRAATLSVRPSQHFATTLKGAYQEKPAPIASDRTLYKALASKSLSTSSSPFVLATGMTDYLSTYPHGCTEQIISQTLPWVSLAQLEAFSDKKDDATQNAAKVVSMLQTHQNGDGGVSLWPGSNQSHTFASLYAMFFLSELRESSLDTEIPKALNGGVMDYLRNLSRQHTSGLLQSRQRAMAIYLLVRNKEVATNYLVDLHETLAKTQLSWEKDITASYMAAAYKLLQQDAIADKLIAKFDPLQLIELSDFYSDMTLQAQHVYLTSSHFPNMAIDVDETIIPLIKPVMSGRLNTISASYTTMALSAYSSRTLNNAQPSAAMIYADDSTQALNPIEAKPFNKVAVPLSTKSITVKSDKPLFYQLVQSGYDSAPYTKALSEGIEVFKEFVDHNGTLINEVKQGDEVDVRIKVRSTQSDYIPNVVLVDLLPGGFEVIRESVPRHIGIWNADYVDIREDRVVYYAGFGANVIELRFKVKATAAGTFTLPSTTAASMYDPSLKAHTAAASITVHSADSF